MHTTQPELEIYKVSIFAKILAEYGDVFNILSSGLDDTCDESDIFETSTACDTTMDNLVDLLTDKKAILELELCNKEAHLADYIPDILARSPSFSLVAVMIHDIVEMGGHYMTIISAPNAAYLIQSFEGRYTTTVKKYHNLETILEELAAVYDSVDSEYRVSLYNELTNNNRSSRDKVLSDPRYTRQECIELSVYNLTLSFAKIATWAERRKTRVPYSVWKQVGIGRVIELIRVLDIMI